MSLLYDAAWRRHWFVGLLAYAALPVVVGAALAVAGILDGDAVLAVAFGAFLALMWWMVGRHLFTQVTRLEALEGGRLRVHWFRVPRDRAEDLDPDQVLGARRLGNGLTGSSYVVDLADGRVLRVAAGGVLPPERRFLDAVKWDGQRVSALAASWEWFTGRRMTR